MFTGISWGMFATVVALLTTAWYGYVLVRFYRAEIKQRFTPGRGHQADTPTAAPNFFIREADPMPAAQWQDTTQQDDVSHLIRRSKEAIHAALQNTFNKAEFLGYLSLLFKEYPSLKGTPYQGTINEIIEKNCSAKALVVTGPELDALW